MSRRERVLPSIQELKEDMKDISFREKVDHLWSYYGVYAVALLALAVLAGGFMLWRSWVWSYWLAVFSSRWSRISRRKFWWAACSSMCP